MNLQDFPSSKLAKSLARINEILERFRQEYPDELGMAFKDQDQLFAEHGWYIYDGCTLEDVLIVLKLFNQGKIEEAQIKLGEYIKENLEEIEQDLINMNPKSQHIIKEAFICHKQQLYFASTILFISLTDGLVKSQLFSKSFLNKIKKRNKQHFLLAIFTDKNPVKQVFIPDKSSESELMRHGIVHGNSTEYGNETNSLKALSLLHYLSIRKQELNK